MIKGSSNGGRYTIRIAQGSHYLGANLGLEPVQGDRTVLVHVGDHDGDVGLCGEGTVVVARGRPSRWHVPLSGTCRWLRLLGHRLTIVIGVTVTVEIENSVHPVRRALVVRADY